MIDVIRAILEDEKYVLQEFGGRLKLYNGNPNIYPEDYIEIDKTTNTDRYTIFEVHRDNKQFQLEAGKEEAAFYAAVMYKRLFDNVVDRVKARNIRNYVSSGDEETAVDCIKSWFSNSIYSMGVEDYFKISFIQTDDKVDVKFGGEYIAEGVSVARGYVVLYNFCEKLQTIIRFCDKIQKRTSYTFDREKIMKMYIL